MNTQLKFTTSLGIAALICASPAVIAASSVELYGVLDVNVEAVNNSPDASGGSKTVAGMRSGGLGGSRWGLRGTEDLGNNLKAIFMLESGIDVTNGIASGGLFRRSALVGLKGNWGQLALGRQRTPTFIYSMIYEPTLGAPQYAPTAHLVPPRHDNLVTYSYETPTFRIGGHYGFSEQDEQIRDDLGTTSTYGAAVTYRPVKMFGAYLGFDRINGIDRNSLTAAGRDEVTNIQTGVRFEQGPWVGIVAYRHRNVDRMLPGVKDIKSHLSMAGIQYAYAPNSVVSLAYYNEHYKDKPAGWKGVTSSTVHQITLTALYGLSKRTTLYGVVSHAINGPMNMGASANYRLAAGKDSQTAVALGVRHRF